MGLLQEAIQRMKDKKQKFKDADEDFKIQHKLEERRKNANERELERYQEEGRQKQIQEALSFYRKQKSSEMWHTNNFTNNQNLFSGSGFSMRNNDQRWI